MLFPRTGIHTWWNIITAAVAANYHVGGVSPIKLFVGAEMSENFRDFKGSDFELK